ncbi:MAG TPA: hypothetical protein VMF70_11570 [Gemmatimonadales bacterium]|nr:hypothetical protein [Gemmatimonadales bacterium]
MTRTRRTCTLLALAAVAGCATIRQLTALRRVDFSIAGVEDGRLAGVDLRRIASYDDLGPLDIGRLALAVTRGDVPLDFRLMIRAENPADNHTAATVVKLAWTLLLDDKETIHGVLDTAVTMPPGETATIPLPMRVNLRQFFDGPARSLVNLAASFAGLGAHPTRIAVRAVPTIDTPLGPITYPGAITIVSRTVGGSP